MGIQIHIMYFQIPLLYNFHCWIGFVLLLVLSSKLLKKKKAQYEVTKPEVAEKRKKYKFWASFKN